MRVRLLRRTDDTIGTIRFIGEVDFADGTWVGVELDRRGKLSLLFSLFRGKLILTIIFVLVGKNDGSVDEMRYFQTTANRGVFVKSEDLAVAL
jgi:dynactin complex subunit